MRDGEDLCDFHSRAGAQDDGGGASVQLAQLPQVGLLPMVIYDSVRRTHDIDHAGNGARVHAALGSNRQATVDGFAGHGE